MEAHSLWPTTGCVAYVTAELLWDPRQDVDALMDRYCKGLFGPAAEPMKRFHAALETGVERWTAERGEPHWFGKEISPITAGRSLEQFRVLSVEEAARAAAALAEAKAAAQTDPLAAKHVEAVALCFGLQHLAVREYWTADRLRTAQVKSEADASRVVEDARALMALRREAADYVANVLGVAPANGYNLFGPVGGRHVNVTYGDMASREPLSAYLGGMTAGMDAASGFLRRQVGPEQAGAWWRRAADAEKEPVLVKAMRSAELHARGVQLQNLVASPGFEEAGKKFGPTEVTPGRQLELAKEQYGSLAVRLWFPERSPFRILLQQNDVHGGEYALTFQGCQRARYDFMAKAEPNARYRVGFWAKCAEGKGSYSYEVFGRAKAENKNVRIGGGPVPCDTTDWQHVAADVETPADCSALLVFVYVNGQAQDARFVIDDQFIGKYP
jgi:hypothetical protein